jgi:hypothetical protein
MSNVRRLALALMFAALLVSGCCTGLPESAIDGTAVPDIAWDALAPNTSSGDRANWEVVASRQVKGRDVADEFKGDPSPGCWMGPTPVPNAEIQPGTDYWYVEMRPKPATPRPEPTLSPTAPPFVPEPFLYRALLLLDAEGRVVARKLFCVIY